jgi:hypothetical protein
MEFCRNPAANSDSGLRTAAAAQEILSGEQAGEPKTLPAAPVTQKSRQKNLFVGKNLPANDHAGFDFLPRGICVRIFF